MNKEIFDQLPADEQPVAAKLNSAANNMKVPQDFQWTLETQLMDAYQNRSQPAKGWFAKLVVPAAWTFAAVLGFFLFNWAIRSIIPSEQTPGSLNTEIPSSDTFESNVRQGNICEGPLALAHGFSVYVTNQDKTAFIELDAQRAIGELRSFAWSADGQLAVVGNTTGTGNIYLTDSAGGQLQPVLSNSELGYLMDVAWSRDGKRVLTWSVANPTVIYLINNAESTVFEFQRDQQINSTPQFSLGDTSIIFLGSGSQHALFEANLESGRERLISALVENDSGFAWSPDGSRLAYFEMRRTSGEAVLILQNPDGSDKSIIASLPIPKGHSSSIPDVANLSWSKDETKLVFEFGRSASDRAIYLAYADGSGLIKLVESAHAPTISSDGNCLAYISDKQVFLLDLNSDVPVPIVLAELPTGRSIPDFRLDKLQWKP